MECILELFFLNSVNVTAENTNNILNDSNTKSIEYIYAYNSEKLLLQS